MVRRFSALLIFGALFLGANQLKAQVPGGADCATAMANPMTLPYASPGAETTCLMGNNYRANNVPNHCGNPAHMGGQEKVYTFVPIVSGTVLIIFNSQGPATSGVYVYDGCPDTANCVAANTDTTPNKTLGFTVITGQRYFITVDVAAGVPDCIAQYTLSVSAPDPFCPILESAPLNNEPNMNFEFGTFNFWNPSFGNCCPVNTPNQGIANNRHVITTGNGTDANTGNQLKLVAPGGGKFSARLGNPVAGNGAERLSKTFVVTPNKNGLIYKYAVVLQDPGHAEADQPRFEIQVKNKDGNLISCGFYKVHAAPNVPCFKATGGLIWKDWATVGIDLRPYNGQQVTVDFSTGDCNLGGHWGYAYLDAAVTRLAIDIIGNNGFCEGDSLINLKAPEGFDGYVWRRNGKLLPDSGVTIKLDTPKRGDTITCTLTPVQGFNCSSSLQLILDPGPLPVAAFTIPDTICEGTALTPSNQSDTKGDTTAEHLWIWGDGFNNSGKEPTHIYPRPGTYEVQLKTTLNKSCFDIAKKTLVVHPLPRAMYTYTRQGRTVNFKGVDTSKNYTWRWIFGDRSVDEYTKDASHTYVQADSFLVTLIVTNYCGADTHKMWLHVDSNGIDTGGSVTGLIATLPRGEIFAGIHPNPVQDFFIATLELDKPAHVSWTITDLMGQELIHARQSYGSGIVNQRFDGLPAMLNPGMYILNIHVEDQDSGADLRRVSRKFMMR